MVRSVAVFSLAVSTLVMAGWGFNIAVFTTMLPGLANMKPNSAVCFMGLGIALWLSQKPLSGSRKTVATRQLIAQGCASLTVLVGLVTLGEHAWKFNAGIDAIFFRQRLLALHVPYPGRVSHVTALEFVMLGLALVLVNGRSARGWRLSQYCALFATFIGLMALIGYAYGAEAFYRISDVSAVALSAALLFTVMGAAILCARPDQGLMVTVNSANLGGSIARRMLPTAFLLPVVIGWVRLQGQHAGLYGTEFGLVIFALSNVLIFGVLVWSVSRSLNAIDAERLWAASKLKTAEETTRQVNDQLREQAAALERRVQERTAQVTAENAERRRAEQELHQFHLQHELVLNAVGEGIHALDREGRITYENPASVKMLGWEAMELVGQQAHPKIHHTRASGAPYPQRECHVYASLRDGLPHRVSDEVFWRKDGSSFPVEYVTAPLRDEGGAIIGAVMAFNDITVRKRAEQELHHAKAAAEAASRAKGEFLANMSHEIRTPMNGVIGMTGLLLDGDLDPRQRGFAETIRSSADALLTILNDILDFSKIESGKLTFETLDFDLVETVEGTVDMLAEGAQAKRVRLESVMAPALPVRLRGDPGRLRQILTNLIGNAIKFTNDGAVTVRLSKESETATHAVVRFQVEDSGIGIPPEAQDRLFQAFSQADGSTTRKYGGTGLGLAIAKQLVLLMDGQIGVQSEPGQGSTFWFTAKLGKQAVAAPVPSRLFDGIVDALDEATDRNGPMGVTPAEIPRAPDASIEKVRILLAEDNRVNQRVALGQLQKLSLTAEAVGTGREVLAALQQRPYDIILMDCQMPEMDGYEATRAIRRQERAPGGACVWVPPVHIIAMTANAMQGDREKCLAAGMDDYLSKPVRAAELQGALERWRGAGRSAQER
ncbi:MAG TPA: ATP-binding protein [Chthoniobacterales bacterium]